jgi:hypothetical protein
VLEDAARFADDVTKLERGNLKMWLDTIANGRLQSTEQLTAVMGMGC